MKTILKKLFFTLVLTYSVCFAAQVKTVTIYFDKDKSILTNGEAQKLTGLKSADLVVLKGHADSDGSDDYNLRLSKKRVDAVLAYVQYVDKGINIEADYFGKKKPVNDNKDEKEKSVNRRVEVSYVEDPMLRCKVPVQHFEVDNSKEQVFTCKHGTRVHIPEGAFGDKKVDISISEYYTADEIFAANLSTKSGRLPIETAGMINITAESDGVPVQPAKALEYKFPRKNKSQDFKFFEGTRDSALGIDWQVEKDPVESNETIVPDNRFVYQGNGQAFTTKAVLARNLPFKATSNIDLKDKELSNFLEQVTVKDRILCAGCLSKTRVDITVNKEGRITSLKTSYTDKNTECDRAIQQFIRECLPKRFGANTENAYIFIDFDSVALAKTTYIKPVDTAYTAYVSAYKAKYEADMIVTSSRQLGWINCDRFLTGTKLERFTVEAEKNASVRLVLKKYKSFFGSEYTTDFGDSKLYKFNFSQIPADEEVVLISTKKEDGKIFLAVEETKTSTQAFTKFNYKAVTTEQLAEAMKNLKI
ncbi:MAG: hypothetical protein JWO06_2317 [Bacteroidota bacterium]|nr:hypothetical protein [Bacteroidota bacterium]